MVKGTELTTTENWELSYYEVFRRKAIYGFQLAPDGKQLSFVNQYDKRVEEVVVDGRVRLVEVPLADICLIPSEGGYPRVLALSADAASATGIDRIRDTSAPPVWSPDGKWLALEHAEGLQIMPSAGGERRTIFKGKLFHPLRRLEPGDANAGYPSWSHDGKFILFATREGVEGHLRMVSADGKFQRILYAIRGDLTSWDWSPDDRRILFVARGEDGCQGDLCILDLETGGIRTLWTEENFEYQKPVAYWMPSGDRILFRWNRSGWSKYWTASAEGKDHKPLTEGDWDDYAFRFSPDGKQIVYASRAGQPGSGDDLWVIPIRDGKARRLTHHLGVNSPIAWSKDNRLFYWHTSPAEPGDLWAVAAGGGEPQRITWSAPLELERKLRAPEEGVIVNEDGTRIPTLIYLPAFHREGQKHPAIVWIHGGPTDFVRYEFLPFHNWLANLGFVVVAPNYRGSLGCGVSYMNAVAGEGVGKNDLSDVLAVGRYARTLPYVDTARGIGVGGRSYGGYLTLRVVTQAPDFFSCAFAGAAIADWNVKQAESWIRYHNHWLLEGWVYEHAERIRERSPINSVDRIQIPLLMYHGEEDHDVPFSQIQTFVEKARRIGVELEFVSYRGEGHVNKKPEHQQDLFDRRRAFFRKHLQPWNLTDNPRIADVRY